MKLRAIIVLVVIAAILGVTFYAVSRPKPEAPVDSIPYVWDFDMDELQHIVINMPREEKSVSFVVHEDRYFYFDVENGSIVDMQRWGGGIPLLLSGPGADRRLVQNATDAQLAEYGFTTPNLDITLTLKDGSVYNVELGNSTPSEQTYYIRLTELREIYTVDYTWYGVISRLVTEPPYPPANFVNEKLTVTPLEASVRQPITITAEMVNTGAVTAQYDVKLMINGMVEATQTIELGRNEKT
ncbi:MAG: DUF4340 domain-containing protein, partial [Dehalococcoidales bacterium]|nr:DUF4340 domain-containing protein [Dehalococcoidales bacterium]